MKKENKEISNSATFPTQNAKDKRRKKSEEDISDISTTCTNHFTWNQRPVLFFTQFLRFYHFCHLPLVAWLVFMAMDFRRKRGNVSGKNQIL